MKRVFCFCKKRLVRTKAWFKGDIMAKIDRYSGIKVGTGYLMGSEIYGKTEIHPGSWLSSFFCVASFLTYMKSITQEKRV